jgi:hypothetical protein
LEPGQPAEGALEAVDEGLLDVEEADEGALDLREVDGVELMLALLSFLDNGGPET